MPGGIPIPRDGLEVEVVGMAATEEDVADVEEESLLRLKLPPVVV